jgi:hypothetical protein
MKRSLFAQLNALAEEISSGAVKAAAAKSASPTPADPGTYTGASAHASASVDNSGQSASTGARASEYETDVKKQQGALAVDNTPELSQEGRQDDVQLNIGTNVAATGEDPAAEKDYKGTKDDPGTSSPVKANDGEKYSGVSFKQARAQCGALGNDILANIINFGTDKLTKQSEMPEALAKSLGKKNEPASKLKGDQHKLDTDNDGKIEGSDLAALRNGDSDSDDKEASFKAGYELAQQLGLEKGAAEASVREVCANTIREADEMADLFIGFMTSKQASEDATEEMAEGEDHSAPADAGSGAGDAPVPSGLEAMVGGDPMAGGMGPEMGGAPEAAGEPSEDEALQELAMALEELGIPPEALLQALSGAGGEGGAAPAGPEAAMAAEAPKTAAAKTAAELGEIGAAVVNFKRAGKFQVKEARTKRSRQLRDIMKQHVLELVNR